MLFRRFVATLCLIAAAAVASTACVSKSDIQSIGNGHYTVAAHASDSMKAEMRAIDKSYAYCGKLKQGTVIDDPSKYETVDQNASGVTVSMTFQCKAVPDPCTAKANQHQTTPNARRQTLTD